MLATCGEFPSHPQTTCSGKTYATSLRATLVVPLPFPDACQKVAPLVRGNHRDEIRIRRGKPLESSQFIVAIHTAPQCFQVASPFPRAKPRGPESMKPACYQIPYVPIAAPHRACVRLPEPAKHVGRIAIDAPLAASESTRCHRRSCPSITSLWCFFVQLFFVGDSEPFVQAASRAEKAVGDQGCPTAANCTDRRGGARHFFLRADQGCPHASRYSRPTGRTQRVLWPHQPSGRRTNGKT